MRSYKPVVRLSEDFSEVGSPPKRSLYIAHASFEPRATAVATRSLMSLGVVYAFVVATRSSLDKISAYRESEARITESLKRQAATVSAIRFNRDQLLEYLRHLHAETEAALSEFNFDAVILDATTFPKDRLWVTIDYIKLRLPETRLLVLYVEPDAYNTEILPSGWLSMGVKRVAAMPRFNGYQHASRPALLVVIVGHEKERMQITARNIEPQKLVLIGQGPQQHGSTAPTLPSILASYIGVDFAHIIDNGASYFVGSRDYLGIRAAIHDIFLRFGEEFNIVISANGTKLQSIGALIACRENRRLTAVYTEPQIYNNDSYSKGWGSTWLLEI